MQKMLILNSLSNLNNIINIHMQQINTIIEELDFKQFDHKFKIFILENRQIKNSHVALGIFSFLIIANLFDCLRSLSFIVLALAYPIYKTLQLYQKI